MVNSILPLAIKNAVVKKRGKVIVGPVTTKLGVKGFTIVLGPNGSGKTSLLRLMHGMERPGNGTVRWQCADAEARTRQAFVFQAPIVMRRSTVQNIAYPLHARGTPKSAAIEQATESAQAIGLGIKLDLEANYLSGGEKQKLAIARALITGPEVLYLDEPTSNLDGGAMKEIEAALIRAFKDGTRIIMATHDLGQARRLASDVLFLYRGKLHEQGSAKTFFKSPKTLEAKAFLQGDILE